MRGRNTEHQTRQHDRASRRANVKDAFNAPSADAVRGARDIILLDDVVTTGATLAAARSTLLRAGARNVLCVAVAH